jgi:hypothetical protein
MWGGAAHESGVPSIGKLRQDNQIQLLEITRTPCVGKRLNAVAKPCLKLGHDKSVTYYVDCPFAFQLGLDIKRNQITLLQRVSEPGLLDIALMEENVLPAFHGDKAIAFRTIEEFHCTGHASILSVNRKKKAPAETPGPITL